MRSEYDDAADCARLYVKAACWIVSLFTLLWLLSGCSPSYEGLLELGPEMRHETLTDADRELTEDARLAWCDRTDGACCPERIEVSLCDDDAIHYSPDGRIEIATDVVSASDWYQQSLYLVGRVCGLPKSNDPADAMCWRSAAMQVSDHDVEVAQRKACAE
jgi:hypothetical protein